MATPSNLLADSPPTICLLEIAPHFNALTATEKLYAHHISRASFLGTRIVLRQISPESEAIYDLILAAYKAVSGDWLKLSSDTEAVQYWIEYAAQFLGNCGNYKSFGDQKFVPRVPKEKLEELMAYNDQLKGLFEMCAEGIYSFAPAAKTLLGYPQDGHVSQYYPGSPGITKEDIAKVHAETSGKFSPENTRLRKTAVDGKEKFELLVASADEGREMVGEVEVVFGDHKDVMAKIVAECDAAAEAALNDTQRDMFKKYSESFKTGSINAHKESQKLWVQDKGPKVESDLGFIESYRDPHGIRAEWEGFVAMVNQEQTKKFGELVARASEFIPRLPWADEFEKDTFLKPDFTSLEVLSFCTSGIPAGINIPNYDDIRQNHGFKNVSLGNILSAKAPNEKVTFVKDSDLALFEGLKGSAFEVQVGVHELLGHGTGKLLQEVEKGKYNFDIDNPPVSPVTGEKVKTWYGVGETWGGVFGSIAASYEECRAECVAMYLGGEKDLLKIFGFTDDSEKKADDVLYIEYLQMARAGLLALEFWDPEYKKWGQGHMQARYSILQTMLQAGDNFVTLESSAADHNDLVIALDRTKIRSHGIPAIGKYLQKLHVFKSTADFAAGEKLYAEMCTVNEHMAKYREVVMRKKLPRKQFVQANTKLVNGEVKLVEYEASLEGLIKSFAEREV
ncbi:peptidase family M49-domain-containing protein [Tricharina praecox]|uniref:peptidase family M49-domain-containing protein n=1 Tax=Tricharina praecox TaxID=43433 RepID=UPI00221ED81E|nr:peptidase family M49-domain-containing protein [Tricharina praecox]KAI5855998.1 peptidase family M49-domain-containing protein [Tricharina praecox]